MAAAIKERLGLSATLIPSSGGVFEVMADGKLIFSKKAEGRFPELEEIIAPLQAHEEGR